MRKFVDFTLPSFIFSALFYTINSNFKIDLSGKTSTELTVAKRVK